MAFPIQAPLITEVVAIPSDGNAVAVLLHDGLELGRSPECGISFDEPWLAPRHVRFRRVGDAYIAEAIGTSPLFVDKERVSYERLHVGDVLIAAQTPILFQHRLGPPAWWADAQALRDRIREDPENDDVRLVFADWLTARDPRHAELIACQIAAERGALVAGDRAEGLLEIRFAAPLAVPVERWTMRRGFLATARVLLPVRGERLLQDHPTCTVTSLDYPPPPRLRQ